MEEEKKQKKTRGPFFWIIMVVVIVLFLGLCCCGGSLFTASRIFEHAELQEVFTSEYCASLEKEGRLDDDPFGWCK